MPTNTADAAHATESQQEALFTHPDDTRELDAMDDAVREVATRLQAIGPVVEGRGTVFGGISLPGILIGPQHSDEKSFAVTTWEAARAVYTNPAVFSSSIFGETTGQFWGRGIFMMDPPEHTRFRSHMQMGFTPKLVASWEQSIIRPHLKRHFDGLKSKGRADLVRELTAWFPYGIVAEVVGFDSADIAFTAEQFKKIQQVNVDPMGAFQAGQRIKEYSLALIQARRKEPRPDLVSAMTRAEVEGELIPDDIFVSMVTHLMQGGIDTVYKVSSSLIHLMLSHPDQMALLRGNRGLMAAAVEEALRLQGVASGMPRLAMKDGDILGVPIKQGEVVWVLHAVVNRDPARWSDPHRFDITRKPVAHMAFGHGPHVCIGMHLARFELARFLEHLLDDLPGLRWDPAAGTPPKITGWTIRGPLSLPVVWDT